MAAIAIAMAMIASQTVLGADWQMVDLPFAICLPNHPELEGDAKIAWQPDIVVPGYTYGRKAESNIERYVEFDKLFSVVDQEPKASSSFSSQVTLTDEQLQHYGFKLEPDTTPSSANQAENVADSQPSAEDKHKPDSQDEAEESSFKAPKQTSGSLDLPDGSTVDCDPELRAPINSVTTSGALDQEVSTTHGKLSNDLSEIANGFPNDGSGRQTEGAIADQIDRHRSDISDACDFQSNGADASASDPSKVSPPDLGEAARQAKEDPIVHVVNCSLKDMAGDNLPDDAGRTIQEIRASQLNSQPSSSSGQPSSPGKPKSCSRRPLKDLLSQSDHSDSHSHSHGHAHSHDTHEHEHMNQIEPRAQVCSRCTSHDMPIMQPSSSSDAPDSKSKGAGASTTDPSKVPPPELGGAPQKAKEDPVVAGDSLPDDVGRTIQEVRLNQLKSQSSSSSGQPSPRKPKSSSRRPSKDLPAHTCHIHSHDQSLRHNHYDPDDRDEHEHQHHHTVPDRKPKSSSRRPSKDSPAHTCHIHSHDHSLRHNHYDPDDTDEHEHQHHHTVPEQRGKYARPGHTSHGMLIMPTSGSGLPASRPLTADEQRARRHKAASTVQQPEQSRASTRRGSESIASRSASDIRRAFAAVTDGNDIFDLDGFDVTLLAVTKEVPVEPGDRPVMLRDGTLVKTKFISVPKGILLKPRQGSSVEPFPNGYQVRGSQEQSAGDPQSSAQSSIPNNRGSRVRTFGGSSRVPSSSAMVQPPITKVQSSSYIRDHTSGSYGFTGRDSEYRVEDRTESEVVGRAPKKKRTFSLKFWK